jgi:UDPglucose 6-dehydrogenase
MREAPSLVTIPPLLDRGAEIAVHDPVAMDEAKRHFGDSVEYCKNNYDALQGADALLIHTEWLPYRRPDFVRMREALSTPLVLDGRNLYRPETMKELGFEYHSVGRRPVAPSEQ